MIIQDWICAIGYYLAKIISVTAGPTVTTRRGPCPTIEITYELHNVHELVKNKTQRYFAFASNRDLVQVFSSVLGERPGVMDTDALIGQQCIIEIGHNTSKTTGIKFANVIAVLPADAKESEDLQNYTSSSDTNDDADDIGDLFADE